MISVDDIRFDYVKIVANHFFPEIHTESSPMRIVHFASRVPDVFCDAVNNGEISASPSDAFLSDMSPLRISDFVLPILVLCYQLLTLQIDRTNFGIKMGDNIFFHHLSLDCSTGDTKKSSRLGG